MKRLWLVVILMSIALVGHAEDGALTDEDQLKRLAAEPQWLNLLHYKVSRLGGRGESYVDDRRFFLHERGHVDALAELRSTLNAFNAQPQSQCRFVARKQWLAQQLPGLQSRLPVVNCPEYQTWRDTLNTKRIVLVFASSYLNSPSSMYGHTFLRFDPEGIEDGAPLLSYALNFGAITNANDNGFLYAYRGLVGGYPGLFSSQPYYEKVKEYSRMDNRDLWEYQLNLTESEIDRMLAHVWELNKINFQYYFFDENCSFRLMELLDVARPGHQLASKFPLVAIPIDTVRAVDDADMIAKVVYRPSNRTKLNYKLDLLSVAERQLALQLTEDLAVKDAAEFNKLDTEKQRLVIEIAYSYLRDKHNLDQRDKAVARRSHQLLLALHRLADKKQDAAYLQDIQARRPLSPELGHRTTLFSAVAGYEDGPAENSEAAYIDLEGRIAYHGLMDNLKGYPGETSLNMGRLVVRLKEGESPQLQQFDILEITSLSARNRFYKPLSWQVNTGLERQWTQGKDELVAQLNAGAGWTYATVADGRVFALIKTRLEYNPGFEQNLDIAAGFSAGAFWQRQSGSSMLQFEHYRFSDGVDRNSVKLSHQFNLGSNSGLRLHFKRSLNDSRGVNEAGISYRYFY